MEDTRKVILFIIIGLLVLVAVVAVVLSIKRASLNKENLLGANTSNINLPQTSSSTPTSTPTPAISLKTYQGSGFSLKYPANWGLLTCTNSSNFELDPVSGQDQKVRCDHAIKPITVLVVSSLSCHGETARIGNFPIVKSKNVDQNGEISYGWCVNLGSKSLDITHRISNFNAPASSPDDFSNQIQQMIFDIQVPGVSSPS